MQAFIASVKEIFLNTVTDSVWKKEKSLKIPLYQREYEWDKSNVADLVLDILNRDKFLGMIILDEKDDCYEISDGQQRLTTILLSWMNIYNHYKGANREQSVLKSYIFNEDNTIRLKNDSVGNYISFVNNNLLALSIEVDKDVYHQHDAFEAAYDEIDRILSEKDRFREFKDKLQKCTFLILIKDMQSTNSDAVEQIFLDINEKSKRLDNASIFKGYCFKIFDETFQEELKNLWIRLKKAFVSFKEFSGQTYRFDDYIYTYLLVTEDENMTENLSPGGRHFLEDKNMDDVERILTQMVVYGEKVSYFYNRIQNDTYMFEDICSDSNSYKTAGKKMITCIKDYLLYAMEIKSAQYQKVPLFWFIYFIETKCVNDSGILMKEFI